MIEDDLSDNSLQHDRNRHHLVECLTLHGLVNVPSHLIPRTLTLEAEPRNPGRLLILGDEVHGKDGQHEKCQLKEVYQERANYKEAHLH